jgi:Carboxymuconolactone decarboxylase family
MIEDPLARRRASADAQAPGGLSRDALFARLAGEPVAGDALCALGDTLYGSVDGRLFEFAALRVAALRDSAYVWRGHCHIATHRRDAHLTPAEIARVAAGPGALEGCDAATVQGVDDLVTRRVLGAWSRRALGDRALAVTLTTLFYDAVTTVMAGAEPGARPIAGIETVGQAALTASGLR